MPPRTSIAKNHGVVAGTGDNAVRLLSGLAAAQRPYCNRSTQRSRRRAARCEAWLSDQLKQIQEQKRKLGRPNGQD